MSFTTTTSYNSRVVKRSQTSSEENKDINLKSLEKLPRDRDLYLNSRNILFICNKHQEVHTKSS